MGSIRRTAGNVRGFIVRKGEKERGQNESLTPEMSSEKGGSTEPGKKKIPVNFFLGVSVKSVRKGQIVRRAAKRNWYF